jgi:DNA-directed RNA polymerase subunit RPC12/RpoP
VKDEKMSNAKRKKPAESDTTTDKRVKVNPEKTNVKEKTEEKSAQTWIQTVTDVGLKAGICGEVKELCSLIAGYAVTTCLRCGSPVDDLKKLDAREVCERCNRCDLEDKCVKCESKFGHFKRGGRCFECGSSAQCRLHYAIWDSV